MAKINFPFRRLADQFYKAARSDGKAEEWRRLGSLIDRNFEEIDVGAGESITFGSITETIGTDESGPFVPRNNHSSLRVLLVRKAGTGAMTVDIYKNGVSVGVVTTTATGLIATAAIDAVFEADTDVLTIAATTVGAGTTWPTCEITLP